MDEQTLIKRLLAQRESWVELDGGKKVKVRRPPEGEFPSLRGGITVDHLGKYVTDWTGFMESDLLGPDGASDVEVPFSAAVWVEVARDNLEWHGKVATYIVETVTKHLEDKAAAAKN